MNVTFSVQCPDCDEDVEDVEVEYTECYGREEFWGAPVRTNDSEMEVLVIPKCPRCNRVTVTDEAVTQQFWEREVDFLV